MSTLADLTADGYTSPAGREFIRNTLDYDCHDPYGSVMAAWFELGEALYLSEGWCAPGFTPSPLLSLDSCSDRVRDLFAAYNVTWKAVDLLYHFDVLGRMIRVIILAGRDY